MPLPIGGCGQKGQPACDPIQTIAGTDGKMYTIHGAAKIVIEPFTEGPLVPATAEDVLASRRIAEARIKANTAPDAPADTP